MAELQRSPSVLVVEDEITVAEVVGKYLRREGYDATIVHDGQSALDALASDGADLVVLDLMLPEVDGLEVCRRMRAAGDATPIIMLTAKDMETDVVLGLGVGADDYVAKPFSPAELVARVQAVLRRSPSGDQSEGDTISAGDLRISASERSVVRGETPVELTAKEFDLLFHMASHPGHVFTRDVLLDQVWDYNWIGDTSTVTVHIRRLRTKVEADPERPRHIKTVWGVGYKFDI
jgi:DNA-binding response OmpR family regulator